MEGSNGPIDPPPNRSVEGAKWHEKRAIIFMDFWIYVAHFFIFMGFYIYGLSTLSSSLASSLAFMAASLASILACFFAFFLVSAS